MASEFIDLRKLWLPATTIFIVIGGTIGGIVYIANLNFRLDALESNQARYEATLAEQARNNVTMSIELGRIETKLDDIASIIGVKTLPLKQAASTQSSLNSIDSDRSGRIKEMSKLIDEKLAKNSN